jgi:nucleoside phosphorylase
VNGADVGANDLDSARPTAVVAAMAAELEPLQARLRGARRLTAGGARVTVGTLGGAPVALAATGDGAVNARRGLAALVAAVRPSRILVVGVAGGLSPALSRAAVVAGARVIDEESGAVHDSDAGFVAAAEAVGIPRGCVVSAIRIADSADEKRRLLTLACARFETSVGAAMPAVVDLESAAFVAAATRANLPWLVLRAVSDLGEESLPEILNRSRDDSGSVSRLKVLGGMLLNPGLVRPLLALRGHVDACARALADGVQAVLSTDTFRQPIVAAAAPRGRAAAGDPTER